jgi:hypothetical protein
MESAMKVKKNMDFIGVQPISRRGRRGVALILILGSLVFLAALMLAFMSSVRVDRQSSELYAHSSAVRIKADSVVNLVMAQLQTATQGEDTNGNPLAWSSQPGMIRTFDTSGALDRAYKLYSWQGMVSSTFSAGMPHSPFSGTYGLATIHGHPKPNFHAFTFLKRMTGDRMEVSGLESKSADGLQGVVATGDGELMRILLWNQQVDGAAAWSEELTLEWKPNDSPTVVASRIADQQGSSYSTWQALGKPHNLTLATERLLCYASQPGVSLLKVEVDQEGRLMIPFTLAPGEVLLLEIEPTEPAALRKGRARHEVDHWDKLMNESSRR